MKLFSQSVIVVICRLCRRAHYCVLAEESGDKSSAMFSQPKEILPVYLDK